MITKGKLSASICRLLDLSMTLRVLTVSLRPLEKKSDADDGLAYGE